MKFEEVLEEEENIENLLLEKPANWYARHWSAETGLWSYEHREKLGLKARDGYVVHHKDGNHHNNHKRNLVKLTRAEHARIEKPALKHDHCKIKGCKNKHFGRGYCAQHYWLKITKKGKKK